MPSISQSVTYFFFFNSLPFEFPGLIVIDSNANEIKVNGREEPLLIISLSRVYTRQSLFLLQARDLVRWDL